MFKLRYDDIVEKIKQEKGLTDEEIDIKIKEKLDKLSGLISKEGAVHIIANELGVKVFGDVAQGKKYKVKELFAGMRSVDLIVKVVKKYETRSFKTEKREGRVASFAAGDETGMTRIVLWDENHINEVEKLKEGDVVKVEAAYVRENNGYKEVHLGGQGSFAINPEGETVEEVKTTMDVEKRMLKDLQPNSSAKVVGTVVQVFEPRFYDACPECNKKVLLEDGKYSCKEHGTVEPQSVPIVNVFFDDGTDNIRAVFFRDAAQKVLGVDDIQKLRTDSSSFEDVRKNALGRQLILSGRVTKNEMFDRIEFVANNVEEVDPKQLAKELMNS